MGRSVRRRIINSALGTILQPSANDLIRFVGQFSDQKTFFAAMLLVAQQRKSKQPVGWYEGLEQLAAGFVDTKEAPKIERILGKCVIFSGPLDGDGYGRFHSSMRDEEGKRVTKGLKHVSWAHRFAFLLSHGYLPEEDVGHRHPICPHAKCINPLHLMDQSKSENSADANRRRAVATLGDRRRILVPHRQIVRDYAREFAESGTVGGVPV